MLSLNQNNFSLPEKLQAAIKSAKNNCILGAANQEVDIERTGSYSIYAMMRTYQGFFIRNNNKNLCTYDYNFDSQLHFHDYYVLNPQWTYVTDDVTDEEAPSFYDNPILLARHKSDSNKSVNPLHDPKFNLNSSHIFNLSSALAAQELRVGNCGTQCSLLIKYLWEHPEGIKKIELAELQHLDHVIVLVNREGNLSDSTTWGNAWVVDPWYGDKGIIFHAKEFESKIVEVNAFAEKMLGITQPAQRLTIDMEIVCSIDPDVHIYPTYSTTPFQPLEYYYTIDNPLEQEKENHKIKYQSCLDELVSENRPKACYQKFFKPSHPPKTRAQIELIEKAVGYITQINCSTESRKNLSAVRSLRLQRYLHEVSMLVNAVSRKNSLTIQIVSKLEAKISRLEKLIPYLEELGKTRIDFSY